MLYNRQFSIAVGPPGQEGIGFTDLRVTFNIVRTSDPSANELKVQVYNAARATRSKFENTDNRIILQAGYFLTGMKMLAVGDINKASTVIEPPTVVTTIEAKDGGRALREARASVSYKAGVSVKSILDAFVEKLEVDGVEITADLTGTFRHGWSYVGPVTDGISKLAARFGFQWSIQNNTIQITERRQPTQREAVMLSPSTGMIGSPAKVDDVRKNLKGDKEQPGVEVKCLLNPALVPGDPVVIESAEYPRATYRIFKATHAGDTHGTQWETKIEVVESGAAA